MALQILLRHARASDDCARSGWPRCTSYRRSYTRISSTAALTAFAFYHVTLPARTSRDTCERNGSKRVLSSRQFPQEYCTDTASATTRLCATSPRPHPRLLPSIARIAARPAPLNHLGAQPSMTARTISHLILLTAITGNLGP